VRAGGVEPVNRTRAPRTRRVRREWERRSAPRARSRRTAGSRRSAPSRSCRRRAGRATASRRTCPRAVR